MPLLLSVGHAVLDHRFWVTTFPPEESRTDAKAYRSAIGGPAAVAAIAAKRLGGEARLLAPRGHDDAGEHLAAALEHRGVDIECYRICESVETPVCTVLIDSEGERFIFRYVSSALDIDASWLNADCFHGADAVLIHPLWQSGAEVAIEHARAMGKPIVLDLDHITSETLELADQVTHVVADETAATALGGEDAASDTLSSLGAWWAITLGARGVRHPNGHVPAFRVAPHDTTGAGDVFHGAFALALGERRTELDALHFAAAAAALHVRDGHPPGRAAVRTFVEESHA